MKCPFCGCEDVRVTDSRPHEDKIKRRRECADCGKRFNTFEIVEKPIVTVRKKDNTFEPFNRDKLIQGIFSAIKKRPVSPDQIAHIADEIERLSSNASSAITTTEIGNKVLEKLRDIDEVSYIRFASVYKDFKDVEGFIAEIKKLNK